MVLSLFGFFLLCVHYMWYEKWKSSYQAVPLCPYQLYAWNFLSAEKANKFCAGQLQLRYKYFNYFMLSLL